MYFRTTGRPSLLVSALNDLDSPNQASSMCCEASKDGFLGVGADGRKLVDISDAPA